MKYFVNIEYLFQKEIEVEASNTEEAEEKVLKMSAREIVGSKSVSVDELTDPEIYNIEPCNDQ